MADISLNLTANPNRITNSMILSSRTNSFCRSDSSFSAGRTFLKNSSFSTSPNKARVNRPVAARISNFNRTSSSSHTYDVVVVGAGIIGLSIARQFLLETDLSVAVVDAALPCSGATGAGQGYIWMVHKTPGTEKWELAMRGRQLWEIFAESILSEGMDPLEILGWKKTGSLLVGKTSDELVMLKKRAEQLSKAGLNAKFLSSSDLSAVEPALMLGKEGGAAFLPDDYQLDAQRTVAYIEKVNREFATDGRFKEYYHEPVTGLLRSDSSGEIEAVQTSKNTLYSRKAVVIAAGCWTGELMHDLIKNSDIDLDVPVKPRKMIRQGISKGKRGPMPEGHLLVLENFNSLKLNHGIMEAGYIDHQAATLQSNISDSKAVHDAQSSSISMTATMDTSGNLVVGSSRQLVGFSTEIDEFIINSIWERAGEFFPILREISLSDFKNSREVRVGLRPYMPDGKPVIGPVPGSSNVFIASGHEGEGLTLALGTAEMVVNMVLGNPGKVDNAPFALHGR